MAHVTEEDKKRFMSKVAGNWTSGCWEWRGATSNGYGRFRYRNRIWRAHRWAWIYLAECAPTSIELDHICRNRKCVRPGHLQPTTARVNKDLHLLRRIWRAQEVQELVPPAQPRSIIELVTAVEYGLPNILHLSHAEQNSEALGMDDDRLHRAIEQHRQSKDEEL